MQSCVKHNSCCFPWSPGSSLVLCTYAPLDMNELLSASEWAPVFRQQILAATRSPGLKLIRMKFRVFLSNAVPALCCCSRLSGGSVPWLWSATLDPNGKEESRLLFPLLPMWNLMLEVRWFLGEGLNELISIPARFCGLLVVQDCCHKSVGRFSFLQYLWKSFLKCKKETIIIML